MSTSTATPSLPLPQPPSLLGLLAHEQRWRLVQALARSDRRVGELVKLLAEPQNLVSYHLRQLRQHNLVRERRSSADQRDVYYSLDLPLLQTGFAEAMGSLHSGLTLDAQAETSLTRLPEGLRALFLCTHNSARSQIAEGLLREMSRGRIEVHSAGTEVTQVHPLAIAAAATAGIDLSAHRSKHLDEYVGQKFDYVITVCDQASEACPVFPGAPERIHWSIADPSTAKGSDEDRLRAFQVALVDLRSRIGFFVNALASRGSCSGP